MSDTQDSETGGQRAGGPSGGVRLRWSSLQVQLPILISGLLVLVVALLGSWSYATARSSLLVSAEVKLDAAVGEFAARLSRGVERGIERLREIAADPAIIEAVSGSEEGALERARERLSELGKLNGVARLAEVWSVEGERVLTAVAPPESVASTGWWQDGAVAPDRSGAQPLRLVGDTAIMEFVAGVRAPEASPRRGERLGYVVLRQRVRSGQESLGLVRNLIATDAVLLFGNRDGSTWTDLVRPSRGPSVDPLDRTKQVHQGHEGVQMIGSGMEIPGTPWVLWAEIEAGPIMEPARSTLARIVLVSVVLVVIGGGGAWWISRRVTAPLRRATEAAEDIAAHRLQHRLVPSGPDELRRLSEAFNLMAERVELRTLELQRVRDEYEDLYESSPDMFMSVAAADGRIVRCNATAARRLLYEKDELIGRELADLCDEGSGARASAMIRRLAETGSVENAPLTLEDRAHRPHAVLLNASVLPDDEGRNGLIHSSLRDVSDVVAAENRRAAVVRGAMDAIITMDLDGRVVEFNPAAEAMFGYTAEEMFGTILADRIVPPSLRQAHRLGLARFEATGRGRLLGQRLELDALRRDGTEFPVELTIVELEGTERVLFTGFLRDLTSLRQAQTVLENTLAELRRSNEELGQFAYVASHDLQEPLRMVASYTELLAERYRGQLDERADKYIRYAVEGARRMQQLVGDLLTYARVGARGKPLVPVDCGAVLGSVLHSMERTIDEASARIEFGALPTVLGDDLQLQQLFFNLLGNAIKFRGAGIPVIRIDARLDNGMYVFAVADNGIGMEMKYAERVFRMFQRLHDRGQYDGSGIGLAIAKKIVDRHGGRIWIESEPGNGATVLFTLCPVQEATP